ncbi:unnamed protein product, partial [Ectocarpus sp. 13 AM-2016]
QVNCPFFYKIGACRHGDRCSRQHHKPPFSQTILVQNLYQNPVSAVMAAGGDPSQLPKDHVQDDFEDFFEEVYQELSKFGEISEMNVCDNLGDHLIGNVYVKFLDEEDADSALKGLMGRWYAGRPIMCEFSPVTDFREARCRQFDEGTCNRGGQCNFMHVKPVPRLVMSYLEKILRKKKGGGGGNDDEDGGERRSSRKRSRSRSRDRDR